MTAHTVLIVHGFMITVIGFVLLFLQLQIRKLEKRLKQAELDLADLIIMFAEAVDAERENKILSDAIVDVANKVAAEVSERPAPPTTGSAVIPPRGNAT